MSTTSRPVPEIRPETPLDEHREFFLDEAEPSRPRSEIARYWSSKFLRLIPAWLQRRAWLLVIAVFVGALAGIFLGAAQDPSYAAQASLAVPSGAISGSPGSSNEADALAITYAAVLQNDDTLLSPAAAQLGVPLDSLKLHLSASVETGTSVLLLRYTAPTSSEAIHGVNVIASDIVSQKQRHSSLVPVNTLDVVQLATSAKANDLFAKYGLEIGVFLGLLVGLILVLVAERIDPRADSSDEVAQVFGRPVAALPSELSVPEFGHAVVNGSGPLPAVTLAPLRWWDAPAAHSIERTLADSYPGTALMVSNALEEGMAHQLDAAAVLVLVVRSGERMRAIGDALERLRLMGKTPAWIALLDRDDLYH
jgi:capsular polysaccharide biosynthesis protein